MKIELDTESTFSLHAENMVDHFQISIHSNVLIYNQLAQKLVRLQIFNKH